MYVYMWPSEEKPTEFALANILRNTTLKIQFKKPALPWYWTHLLSIIILSYLLAFVQLSWQVDIGWFLSGFDVFSWHLLILGQGI